MRFRIFPPLAVILLAASVVALGAQRQDKRLFASLSSFDEVLPVSTPGHGQFVAEVDPTDTTITYELSFNDLLARVTQAHIHFGGPGMVGGIMIFLCGGSTNPGPPGTPACPEPGDSVSRTVGAADVVGPAGQGIAPMEWEEALAAIRAGFAYANVHTIAFPGGEIRGQIR
jgi:hypothetical protein